MEPHFREWFAHGRPGLSIKGHEQQYGRVQQDRGPDKDGAGGRPRGMAGINTGLSRVTERGLEKRPAAQ